MIPLQRLFRSSMAYAFVSWEFTADICLLKLIYLENKVPHLTQFRRRTRVEICMLNMKWFWMCIAF